MPIPSTKSATIDPDVELPVDLQAARQRIGESSGDMDTELVVAMEAATRYCEEWTGRVFRREADISESFTFWPGPVFGVNYNPVLSVTSIQYYAAGDDTLTTMDPADYLVNLSDTLGSKVQLLTGPISMELRIDAFQINYKAGYGADKHVDARAREAILLLLPYYVDGAVGKDFDNTVKMARAMLTQMQWRGYQ